MKKVLSPSSLVSIAVAVFMLSGCGTNPLQSEQEPGSNTSAAILPVTITYSVYSKNNINSTVYYNTDLGMQREVFTGENWNKKVSLSRTTLAAVNLVSGKPIKKTHIIITNAEGVRIGCNESRGGVKNLYFSRDIAPIHVMTRHLIQYQVTVPSDLPMGVVYHTDSGDKTVRFQGGTGSSWSTTLSLSSDPHMTTYTLDSLKSTKVIQEIVRDGSRLGYNVTDNAYNDYMATWR